jgi:competence protein ComEA
MCSYMVWLYRLQQRLSITSAEATVILVLSFLFLLGLTVRYVQHQAPAVSPDAYAAADRLFEAGAASLRAGQPSAARPVAAMAAVEVDTLQPDTTHRQKATPPPPGRLNLNTATAAQLETLPRIGPKMAERILAFRAEHGPFRRVQDLTRVRGIGEKTLARLEPYLYVETAP